MLKIIIPIIVFLFLVFGVSWYWEKANIKNKKKISIIAGIVLVITLSITVYLIID